MTYATRQDLEQRYTAQEVAQLEASGRDIDRALTDADGEIDSYLSVRYPLPLVTTPQRIVSAACDIARFRLFGINSEGEPMERYKLAIAWLRDVSKGNAEVPGLVVRPDSTSAVGIGNVVVGQARSNFDWAGH